MCNFYLLKTMIQVNIITYISLLPRELDEFEDHCYSFGSKNTIVKIGSSYDNEISYEAVIALVSACIVTKCHR